MCHILFILSFSFSPSSYLISPASAAHIISHIILSHHNRCCTPPWFTVLRYQALQKQQNIFIDPNQRTEFLIARSYRGFPTYSHLPNPLRPKPCTLHYAPMYLYPLPSPLRVLLLLRLFTYGIAPLYIRFASE